MAIHHSQLKGIIAHAADMADDRQRPDRKSLVKHEWDLAGNCMAPVAVDLYARPAAYDPKAQNEFLAQVRKIFPGAKARLSRDPMTSRILRPKHITVAHGTAIPTELLMFVRCRKCDKCLEQRRRLWAARALSEVRSAERTWFGTLTLRPEAHMTMLSRARVKYANGGSTIDQKTGEYISDDFDMLPFGEQFKKRHSEISPELTKFIKRIRKESGCKFRYLLVAEHHLTGLPHYHMLIHEHVGNVKHATLAKQWLLGFEKWRLLSDAREATYLCKYLSKTTCARVRASGGYGNGLVEDSHSWHVITGQRAKHEERHSSSASNAKHVELLTIGDKNGIPSRIST